MEIHPAATVMPELRADAFEALKADLAANGQQVPIALWQGKVLDGRNRLRACQELGVRPICRQLETLPHSNPVLYVLSANLHRRHLTPTQVALVGARARDFFDKEARKRKSSAYRDAAGGISGDARDMAGAVVGVSGRAVDYATRVLRQGDPSLVQACERGEIAISLAAHLAQLPSDEQKRLVAQGKKAIREALRGSNGESEDQQIQVMLSRLVSHFARLAALLERKWAAPFAASVCVKPQLPPDLPEHHVLAELANVLSTWSSQIAMGKRD